jgi:hypothetical protein
MYMFALLAVVVHMFVAEYMFVVEYMFEVADLVSRFQLDNFDFPVCADQP